MTSCARSTPRTSSGALGASTTRVRPLIIAGMSVATSHGEPLTRSASACSAGTPMRSSTAFPAAGANAGDQEDGIAVLA